MKLNIVSALSSVEEEEKDFYDSLVGDFNYNFIKHLDSSSGYKAVDKFKYIVGCQSTLLYESLGRRNRTIFFDARGFEFGPFGWPLVLESKGPFWTNEINKSEFERLMNFLIDCSDEQWQESMEPIASKLTSYDNNNSLLREVLIN